MKVTDKQLTSIHHVSALTQWVSQLRRSEVALHTSPKHDTKLAET